MRRASAPIIRPWRSACSNLAGVAVARDDHGAAQRFNDRAIALYERSGSSENPELATAIEHTALIHRGRGELGAALAAQTRAQAIRERRFGRNHAETALGLHNLGDIQRARGELVDAERSYTAAIAIHERSGGPDEPIQSSIRIGRSASS